MEVEASQQHQPRQHQRQGPLARGDAQLGARMSSLEQAVGLSLDDMRAAQDLLNRENCDLKAQVYAQATMSKVAHPFSNKILAERANDLKPSIQAYAELTARVKLAPDFFGKEGLMQAADKLGRELFINYHGLVCGDSTGEIKAVTHYQSMKRAKGLGDSDFTAYDHKIAQKALSMAKQIDSHSNSNPTQHYQHHGRKQGFKYDNRYQGQQGSYYSGTRGFEHSGHKRSFDGNYRYQGGRGDFR